MKKNKIIFVLLVAALIGLTLTACSEDDLSTNQYQSGVSLNVWGPNPVVRGGTLRFVGSNLDQLASVNIPGVGDITNYEVVKPGTPGEIRVTVPKEGPTVGYITLKTKTDQTITTKQELTYIEGIEFEGFSPASVMPGEIVTIKGDYLNLVHSLSFADNVLVSETDFIEHDRYTIRVAVPEDAKTGKISLYDADLTIIEDLNLEYQIIESEEVIEIGVPTISKVSSPRGQVDALASITAKAWETITITGTYLNIANAINIGGVEIADITVADDGTSLSFVLIPQAPDGDITLVCKSGVEVPVGTLVTVKPSNCTTMPNPVKAGQTLTINGNDMEVVTAVELPDANGDYTITITTNIINTMQAFAFNMPAEATEGKLKLVMANGERVEVPFTLIKPIVTSYDSSSVSAGSALTIKGTDLDLVKKVQFGTSDIVAVEGSSDAITLIVPMNATSGSPTLTLANGSTVANVPAININEALFCYATELPGEDAEIKAGGALTLIVANGDKLTGVQINGTDCQYVLTSDSQLIIGVPENAGKGSKVRLISSNGEITYTIDFIPNTEVTTVLWTGVADLDGWSWNWQIGDGTAGASNPKMFIDMDLQEGDIIRVYATAYNDWWQIQFYNGHWEAQNEIGNATGLNNGHNINSGIYNLEEHGGCIEITATAELVRQLTTYYDWGYCWIMQGEGVVITKIAVTHYTSAETIVWQGEAVADDWGNQPYMLSDGGTELLAAGMKVGSILRIYITPMESQWWLQVFDGHWGGQLVPEFNHDNWNLAEHNGAVELTVTEDIFSKITTPANWGGSFILNGDNVICTKVTIE